MRVLHVPFSYFPSPHGGTEVYVAALANALQMHGVASVVAAPGERNESYEWEGVAIHRFKTSPNASLEVMYGEGDAGAASEFGKIIDQVKPDLVHFHALTPGASVLAMREAKRRSIPLVFTYHTPTVSCVRGTMMKWGHSPCNGLMNAHLCTACALHGKGLPRFASLAVAALPAGPLAWLGSKLGKGQLATALQMPALVRKRHAATRTVFKLADQIVAVCDWVRNVLLVNGVPANKMALCRQGLPGAISAINTAETPRPHLRKAYSPDHPLRLVFFGRLDATKGVQVIIAALRKNPELPVAFDIYGIAQGNGGVKFREQLMQLTGEDARIRFCDPVESAAVPHRMRDYDLVVIPSQCLETGPLIVYEAFAAGVPVLGSKLGGIAELVVEGQTGKLLYPGNVAAWASELDWLATNPRVIASWRSALSKPRTMENVASEMAELYTRLSGGL